jgi:acyl carrier protein
MVLDDGLITALTPERIEKVLAPKVAGARNLDALTRSDDLDYFILFSSAAAMFGNPGQASYVAANGYLDGLARERQAQGHKALSVAWGAITDVGVLTRDKSTAKSLSRHTGGIEFTSRDGLDLLAQILADDQHSGVAAISLAAMNWGMARSFLPIMNTPAYDLIRREAEARGDGGVAGADLQTTVLSLDEAAAKKAVSDYLVKEVAAIFRMPPEDINPKRSLTEIGMDSLMGLELRMAIERQIGVDIMKVSMSGGTTINDIAEHVTNKLRNASADADSVTPDQTLMISQHITEPVDLDALRQFEGQVSAREADLLGGVL